MINKINLLKISDNKPSFIYKVERGDCILSIAEKFHTTPTVIIYLNNLKEELEVGEFIIIERLDGVEYFVKPSDTIESIALEFGTTALDIMSKNKTDIIFVGQKLYI